MTTPVRRPWVAFVLSLLMPGLGQFYCGRWLAAALFYIPLLALALLHRLAATLAWGDQVLLLVGGATLLLLLAAALEAASGARQLVAYMPTALNRWYFYAPAVLWNAILVCCIAWLATYRIPSSSMAPTVIHGDSILATVYGFPIRQPARCDVATFTHDMSGGDRVTFVKRVVALAGDRVALQNGRLIVNGVVAGRDKIADGQGGTIYRETLPGGCSYLIMEQTDSGPLDNMDFLLVPAGTAFVLGDNRDDSMDSRVAEMGPVPMARFLGRVIFVVNAADPARDGWIDSQKP